MKALELRCRADAVPASSAYVARPTCADVPARLPELRVVLGDAEADLLANLEAPGRAQEHELGRLVRVLRGEDDAAVVQPARKRGLLGPAKYKVPVKEVVVCGVCIELVRRLRALPTQAGVRAAAARTARDQAQRQAGTAAHQLLDLAQNSPDGRVGCVELCAVHFS